jgi:hypothetical protein
MARISTYPLDSTVVGTDKLIGTDQDNAASTKNYAISDLGAYFGTLTTGKVWIGDAQGQKAESTVLFSNETSGFVGIGTITPTVALDVTGAVTSTGAITGETINSTGAVTGGTIVKDSATADDILLGDGTTTLLSAIFQPGLVEYTDNADAITGGLVSGQIYRTGDDLKIVH